MSIAQLREKYKFAVTHSESFHADDVLAGALIREFLGIEKIIRTRDPEALDKYLQDPSVLVFDVGGHHHPVMGNFDHHQAGFKERDSCGTMYSAVGLIWEHIKNEATGAELSTFVSKQLRDQLIRGVDANDNGAYARVEGVQPPTFAHIIGTMNPPWCEQLAGNTCELFDSRYEDAVALAGTVLRSFIDAAAAAEAAVKAIQIAVDPDSEIFVMNNYLPWAAAFEHLQEQTAKIVYVVFPSPNGHWKVQAVAVRKQMKKALPEKWAGKTGAELAELTSVPDAEFCHNARFICGAASKEGALQLAALALSL